MGMATQAQFHVLAVDDSLIDRKLIERLFKISSYHVTTVDSGSKALEFLGLMQDPPLHQEMEVNLVITDYCMPGMTGYDLLKKIKESSSLKDIPVVIMSSENVPSRITRCLEEGAEEFLLKPVRLSDVNRLRPHVLKAKLREENELQQEQLKEEVLPKEEILPEKVEENSIPKEDAELEDEKLTQQSNIKRKTMEEISPERTRTRYSEMENGFIRII